MIPGRMPVAGMEFLEAVGKGTENALVFGRDPGAVARAAEVIASVRGQTVMPLCPAARAMARGRSAVTAVLALSPSRALGMVGECIAPSWTGDAGIRRAVAAAVDVAVEIAPDEEDGIVAWAVGDGSGPLDPVLRRIPTGRALTDAIADAFG